MHSDPPSKAVLAECRRRGLLDRRATAWTILGVALLATALAYVHAERERRAISSERFELLAHQAKVALERRMGDYAQLLRGVSAHFASSEEVDRASFRAYVEMLELELYLPGAQGVGFTRFFPADERAEIEASVRAEGLPRFAVQPSGRRDPMSAIVFLEPFDRRNVRALGFDMYSEPVRRAAMDRARDTGRPALSGRVTLVQEFENGVQPGFLLYMPVYRPGTNPETLAERRESILGFVYSPFRAVDLMEVIFEPRSTDVQVEIYDEHVATGDLLYDSGIGERSAEHVTELPMMIAGHRWVGRFHSSPSFEASRASAQPALVAFGGGALGLLLFWTLQSNARHRSRMREVANALVRSRDNFEALVENIPGTVFRGLVEGPRAVRHLSVGIEALTGEPRARYISGEIDYDEAIHTEDAARVRRVIEGAIEARAHYAVEYRIIRSPGEVRWVVERGRTVCDASGTPLWLDGVILDIDDRKRAEMAVHEMAYHDPLTELPNRRLLLDRLEHQLAVAGRAGRLGALLFLDLDRFKEINDSLGHEVGDKLLVEVARRLRACLRDTDTVARLGGDEFVILLDELGTARVEAVDLASTIAEKIGGALNRPYELGEHRCESTPSIGVVLFDGHEESPELVLRRADEAMYAAKSAGRNRVRFYGELTRVRV